MRCDSIFNECHDLGMRGVEEGLNASAERAVRNLPIAPCTFVQINERNEQRHTVAPLGSSVAGGFQAGFIALSPGLHL